MSSYGQYFIEGICKGDYLYLIDLFSSWSKIESDKHPALSKEEFFVLQRCSDTI